MITATEVHQDNDLSKALARVMDAGWANESDGNSGWFGRFGYVTITPNEISELYAAVFNDDHTPSATLQPGNFLVAANPDGKTLAVAFDEPTQARVAFEMMRAEYDRAWKHAVISADIAAMGNFFEHDKNDTEFWGECTCDDPKKAGGNKADGSHWVACPVHDGSDDNE